MNSANISSGGTQSYDRQFDHDPDVVVSRETSAPGFKITIDATYTATAAGILKMIELLFGILVIALSSAWHDQAVTMQTTFTKDLNAQAAGWVIFVSVVFFCCTMTLFLMLLLKIHDKIRKLSWPFFEFIYLVITDACYVITAIVSSVYAANASIIGACCAFCWLIFITYTVELVFAFFAYRNSTNLAFSSRGTSGNPTLIISQEDTPEDGREEYADPNNANV